MRMMRVAWVLEGLGAGTADVEDIEAAAGALSEGIRGALAHLDPTALAHVLHASYGPLRASLLAFGGEALADSGEWQARSGGILITLRCL
jgi:hypothetical protein